MPLKGPNRVTKDIQLSSGVAFSTCDNPIGDMCWSTDFQPTAINTCDGSEYEDLDSYGSINSYCDENYWAGAKLSCQEKEMELPTGAQLAQLASELYLDSNGNEVAIGATETKDNLKVKDEYKDNPPLTLVPNYWSSEKGGLGAYSRRFGVSSSSWTYYNKNSSNYRAICISN